MIKTEINADLDLLIFTIIGETSVQGIIDAMNHCKTLRGWHHGQDTVIDQRKMEGAIRLADYNMLIDYVMSHCLEQKVKHASIVSTHTRAAMSDTWKDQLKRTKNMNYRTFFNVEQASQWLDVNEDKLRKILK